MHFLNRKFIAIFSLCFAFLVSFFFSPASICACGMAISINPDTKQFDYVQESDHQVFINYAQGVQKMIVSADLERAHGRSIIWLFPIPADPQRVSVDILNAIPKLSGEDISVSAKQNVKEINSWLKYTQIYTILPKFLLGAPIETNTLSETRRMMFGALPVTGGVAPEPDVLLFKHLEKEGVTAEVLTAKTANGLYDYLKNKGLNITPGAIPTMDHYIGRDYAFIALWISDTTSSSGAGTKGFFVSFPTDKIYYPLLPETVYQNMYMPMTIRVLGYASDQVYKNIQPVTKVTYYIDRENTQDLALSEFFAGKMTDLRYTKFNINATANLYTEDLWIGSLASPHVYLAWFLTTQKALSGILLGFLLSFLTGVISGLIVFKEFRNKYGMVKSGFIGLFNCLTILGVFIALVFTTKQYSEPPPAGTPFSRLEQLFDGRKFAFIVLYSVLFLVLLWVTEGLTRLVL